MSREVPLVGHTNISIDDFVILHTPLKNEMFTSLTLSTTADDRQQISFVWNKAPLSHVRPFTSSPWNSSSDFKLPHVKEIREVSTKVGTITGPVHFDKSHLSSAIPALSHGKDELLPVKGLIHQTLFLISVEVSFIDEEVAVYKVICHIILHSAV
jgi:hypothetical protein